MRWGTALASALLAVSLAACGGGDGGGDDGDGDDAPKATELTVGIPTGINAIDPAKDVNGRHHFFRYLAYEPIVRRDPVTGEFGPALAESFGYVGEDNTAYEFTLREDAKFADGSPVDAEAVKAWLEHFVDAGAGFTALMPIDEITTDGDRTVRLELGNSNPIVEFYLSASNWGYVSQVIPERMDTEMLGAGPYVYDPDASVEGDRYVFTVNDNYYDPSVQHYEKVTVRVIDNHNSMLSAVRSGEIDFALGDSSTVKAADEADGVDVSFSPGGWAGLEFYDLAGKESPLGDVRVRQALNYAVDRETITEALMGKWGEPTSAWLPLEDVAPEAQNYFDYDPDKARQLLEEAGYADGFELKILVQGWAGNAGRPMMQAVAADLEKVGVDLVLTEAATSGDFYGKVLAGEWVSVQVAQLRSPIYSWATNRWVSGGSLDMFGNDNSQTEKMLTEASKASQERARELWDEFTMFVTENAYMLPVFATPIIAYTNADKVAGITSENVNRYLPHSPLILEARPK